MLKPKVCRSPTNFKIGRWLEHALSNAMASYKACEVGLLHVGGGYRVPVDPAATQLVCHCFQTERSI